MSCLQHLALLACLPLSIAASGNTPTLPNCEPKPTNSPRSSDPLTNLFFYHRTPLERIFILLSLAQLMVLAYKKYKASSIKNLSEDQTNRLKVYDEAIKKFFLFYLDYGVTYEGEPEQYPCYKNDLHNRFAFALNRLPGFLKKLTKKINELTVENQKLKQNNQSHNNGKKPHKKISSKSIISGKQNYYLIEYTSLGEHTIGLLQDTGQGKPDLKKDEALFELDDNIKITLKTPQEKPFGTITVFMPKAATVRAIQDVIQEHTGLPPNQAGNLYRLKEDKNRSKSSQGDRLVYGDTTTLQDAGILDDPNLWLQVAFRSNKE